MYAGIIQHNWPEAGVHTSPELVVALVSTDSLSGLNEAYLNYFADSEVFVGHLHTLMAPAKITNPNGIPKFFHSFGWKTKHPAC